MAKRNPYYSGPPSSHFDGLRFFNPGVPGSDKGLREVLRWKLQGQAARWPRQVPVVQAVPEPRCERLTITMVGHATLLIQVAGLNLLTDPVWSERASPLSFAGPKRVAMPGIAFEQLPPIEVVLLSHNHYDHFDVATLKRLQQRDAPLFVTPLGNDTLLKRHLPNARVACGDWGEGFDLCPGIRVEIVPSNHWSSRSTSDRRMALWGGFMLRSPAGLLYFAGDTGYAGGQIFRDLRKRFGPVDVGLIPIGAYAPEWFMAAQHCTPEEAIRIMQDMDVKRALGIHWGTFQLTDEARDEPAQRLRAGLAAQGLDPARFLAAEPGLRWRA